MDLDQMRLDFRDAALFWGWSEEEKREIGSAVQSCIAKGDAGLVQSWAGLFAEYAEEWRRLIAPIRTLNKHPGDCA